MSDYKYIHDLLNSPNTDGHLKDFVERLVTNSRIEYLEKIQYMAILILNIYQKYIRQFLMIYMLMLEK